jgi:hypothetical protein
LAKPKPLTRPSGTLSRGERVRGAAFALGERSFPRLVLGDMIVNRARDRVGATLARGIREEIGGRERHRGA